MQTTENHTNSKEAGVVESASLWDTALSTLKKVRGWQPLTVRGVVAVCLSLVGLQIYAFSEFDLAANILATAALSIVLLVLLLGFYLRFTIGRKIKAEIHFDETNAFSGQATPAGIVLTGTNLLPYFQLTVEREFKQHPSQDSSVKQAIHIVKGKEVKNSKRHLIDEVEFPHRGIWEVKGLSLSVGDALGFVLLSWELPVSAAVEVSPPRLKISPLPVIAAAARAGDQMDRSDKRSGDYYDIRPYDPADGTKRILWKTYARSGELVVRRPEPATVPEGEVALYLVASRKEDHVASCLNSYAQLLEDSDINILFGTDGLSVEGEFPRNIEEINNKIIEAAWSPEVGSGKGFAAFTENLINSGRTPKTIVVFGSASSENDWHSEVSAAATARAVQITAAIVGEEIESSLKLAKELRARTKNLTALSISDLIEVGKTKVYSKKFGGVLGKSAFRAESETVLQMEQNGWEVIRVNLHAA